MTEVEVRFGGVPAEIDAGPVVLRRWSMDDVAVQKAAVNDSLEHLRPWMPWAASAATEESVGEYLRSAVAAFDAGKSFDFSIRDRATDEVIGGCGLMARIGPGALEIGYWVAASRAGTGVGTAAASALVETARGMDGVRRLEIHCDEGNVRSAAIPRKLGFRLDRVEQREPTAPGESDRSQVWILDLA
jgi:RimJ/RimL family protein N-acetyltransferase